ncbi:hypothetical protein SAMN05421770_102279 [Granulicella rosea]|uniref:Uncharacterized protein n=1 Tax=Granulicella rosea TaxID=474952 RepID=A0A239HA31_9BACT|nr:hypothetical protein [Granulicella rosea]SNS77683.1 hypothetical protein SAMN05421770_102279 [Granulicella rosea]
MISLPQIELNVVRAYIQHVQARFPAGHYLNDRYVQILKIREWQLRRRLLNETGTLADLEPLNTGHREAERFLFDVDKGSRKDVIREINDILQLIAMEFFAEITTIEAQHPHLGQEFAREQEAYRLMWNSYVEEAEA